MHYNRDYAITKFSKNVNNNKIINYLTVKNIANYSLGWRVESKYIYIKNLRIAMFTTLNATTSKHYGEK